MILTKSVKVKWRSETREWYEKLDYTFTKWNDEFEVKVEDLSNGSSVEIVTLCDYCLECNIFTLKKTAYSTYIRQTKNSLITKDCCKKCTKFKVKESNFVQYGVNSIFQLESAKEKSKITLNEKYGVDNYTKTDEFKLKYKITSNKKYGFDHPGQNQHVKDKTKITVNKKYGVDNVFQNEKIKQKSKDTCQEKYDVDYAMQNIDIKEKASQTNIDRYGGKSPSSNAEVREKMKQTNLDTYGTEYYSQTEEFKIRFKETSLKNWGKENPSQNAFIKAKVAKSFYKNGTCPTSTQQLEIFGMLKENNYIVELNYPLSRMNLDVAIFIDNIKINLEYDAQYFHKDQQKDRKRDEFTKSQGWKILRIKSSHKIPTLEQLIESINKLVNSDRTFTQIILDDWKVEEVI